MKHCLKRPIVQENGKRSYSACTLFADPLDHMKGTMPCNDGWEFLIGNDHSTVVTEFELVCEREPLQILIPYISAVSAMAGSLISGISMDKYGRKYVLLVSLLCHTSLGVFLHFLPLYGIFTTVYSLQGFLIAGVQCASFLLLVENLPTQWHNRAALAFAMFQCSGQLLLAILAWLIRHWRYIQLVISAPGVVVIGYFWLLPRSLAWLVVEKRHLLAERTLSRFCGGTTPLPPDVSHQVLKACRVMPDEYAPRHGFETVICSARLRTLALTHYFIWFVVSLVSKCAAEDLPVYKDNPYSGLFVHGVLELAFVILIFLASGSVGLKLTQGTSLCVSGICCIFSAIVHHQVVQLRTRLASEKGFHHLAPLFALLGKTIASASRLPLWVHAVKTFPTGVRGLCFGSCMLCSHIAYLFIPSIKEMDNHHQYTALAACGVLGFIGGLLTYFLIPDLTDRPLPTLAEEIEIGRTKIINDSDLDCGTPPGFLPNIPTDAESGSNSSNGTINRNVLSRLAVLLQRKTSRLFSLSRLKTTEAAENGAVFEPVTGFVFKWDQAEPAVTISDFEKQMSSYWKPNSEPNDKKIDDKHLNSLNILYNIESHNVDNSVESETVSSAEQHDSSHQS